MLKKYFINIVIAIDQLCNAILGGDPDETISSRLGKVVARNAESNNLAWLICYVLDWIDPGHCRDAIEKDEGKDEVIEL